ncbi:trans-sulfuration enzyme family protein [Nocardiopsis changdeensis]|uniref:Aminotransferase class I/II-fold pyridoxal phosphate-dependent enzyme n=1 Tax=Nocardiopsis changdeensis TaxID=2831969 RepID=A0ABX8BI45_9ACTN|nr:MULTISPECIES: aminotransferase class I/II-fold pyridoxal phosphate-dependent enzyme [Nocardiopsis]QUX21900.1 aminotransferase class I/II-fold pyridoxal phosphate-dependent enzyme [Nocardiopsis changdeensis]QYX37834.1 aminotransferase class I/II-fold pyridoxal phosphate-dependent enzyme [Nocardiopsis sp. MT53]
MSYTPAAGGEHTRAVSPPPAAVPAERPMRMPVHRATTYAFDTSQDYADVLSGAQQGYSYARIDSPTVDAFAEAVAALEGAGLPDRVRGQAFASGMGALSTVFMALTEAGSHVVAARSIYGNTYSLLDRLLRRFGVRTDFVDITDLDAVREAVRPGTAVLFTETLSNPTMTVSDLPGLAQIAREAGAALVVDSTFASPAVCRPLEYGADIVVHSATKYIGGHSDTTGGVAVAAPSFIDRIRSARIDLGPCLAPDEAYLLHRGLETLPLRVQRQCETAAAFAAALAEHPLVERVDHPSLDSHPQAGLAAKLFDPGRYGAVVTVHPRGGWEAGMAFADRLKVATIAASLGGTHTLAGHVASTSHRNMNDVELAAAGISPGAVRFSIGLEDPQDLIGDALAALGGN